MKIFQQKMSTKDEHQKFSGLLVKSSLISAISFSEIQEEIENDSIQMKNVKKITDKPARESRGHLKVRTPSRGTSTFMGDIVFGGSSRALV